MHTLSHSPSLSLSLPLSVVPARLPPVSILYARCKRAPSLLRSLSSTLPLPISRLRPLSSPAAPIHFSGGTTILRARYSLFPLRRCALALLLRLLRVRVALRLAYSRSRSPASLDPLVCVRVFPSLDCAVSYALFQGARPGDVSVCECVVATVATVLCAEAVRASYVTHP